MTGFCALFVFLEQYFSTTKVATIRFDIGNLDNKIKEATMTKDDLYQIFDENGQHKLNKFSTEPTTKFNIDFFDEKLKIFVIIPEIIKVKTNGANKVIGSLENARRELILSKDFKISSDSNKVTVDNIEYEIPKFSNRKTMKNEDKNTWEIIFRQIFHESIFNEMQRYKAINQGK